MLSSKQVSSTMEVSEEAEDFSVSLHSAASSSSSTGNSKSDDDDSFPEVSDDGLEDATVPPEEDDKQMIGSKVPNTKRWKVFVFVVLCINTALVITATTLFLEHEENEEFETAFSSAAQTVTNAFQDNAQTLSHNIEILSEHIAAFTLDANVEWPYVTLPNFEQRVAPIRKDSMVDFFGFLPLVETMQRERWEDYVVNHQEWIQESYLTLTQSIQNSKEATIYENYSSTKYSISPQISISVNGQKEPYIAVGPYAPLWQMSPPPPPEEANVINEDLMASPRFRNLFEAMQKQQMQSAISEVMDLDLFNDNDNHNDNHNNQSVAPGENHLKSAIFQPIYDSYTHNINSSKAAAIKGFALGVFSWKQFFSGVLPNGVNGIDCVLNFCGHSVHSFRIDGEKVTCIGEGSLQEKQFSGYAVEAEMDFFHSYDSREDGSCTYSIAIYPSDRFRSSFETKQSAIFTAVIAAVFVGTGLVFLLYVYIIGRRQNKVMDIAMGTSAIVASLFPKTVRDKIILDAQEEVQRRRSSVQLPERGGDSTHGSMVSRGRRRSSLLSIQNQRQRRQQQGEQPQRGKPIADLFPAATVLFADIVGFTAWSSVREPTQVFQLLETIYHSFDEIAKRRRVFKVETIGDCYVAVCGLPDPNKDHAQVMARFARDCLFSVGILTRKLEVTLGPDTGDLTMRFGLHSGPVTAGVLRGERSRFQLFGDTVNTAARMESNGKRDCIHISEQTAQYLAAAGKSHWFYPREDKVVAKGKGEMQTYWVRTKQASSGQLSDVSEDCDSDEFDSEWLDLPADLYFDSQRSKLGLGSNAIRQCLSEQNQRLADWNSNQLLALLNQVVVQREASPDRRDSFDGQERTQEGQHKPFVVNAHIGVGDSGSIISEVKESISMPEFNCGLFQQLNGAPMRLSEVVQQQLHDFVSIICSMYVDHPFHSYQHASTVTLAVQKLLSRIVAPQQNNFNKEEQTLKAEHDLRRLHEHSFGIASDPLSQFAVAFSALIHDVDHPGVPNSQLVAEKSRLARIYNNKSIAEQNSFQTGWDLLMDPSFDQLRMVIFTNKNEYERFRAVVVNSVAATDLFNSELQMARDKRWEELFESKSNYNHENNELVPVVSATKDGRDKKAALVLDYLIQASDIAHTMQHWHVYTKWNEKLYIEMLKAYDKGRLEKDPREYWFDGEIEFLDKYAIPLANKLHTCGVFGAYCDEYLNYAKQNRTEWVSKGREVVKEMTEKYNQLKNTSATDGEEDTTERHGEDLLFS